MSKAEELLNSLASYRAVARLIDPIEEPHIVIGADRYITVPDELKRLAVQYDHNIETVTFDCPRYWDDHDMSEMGVYINYMLSDETVGIYKAQNVRVDDDDSSIMHFEWTINNDITTVSGNIVFLVCVKNVDEYDIEYNHWNTELCKDCYVSEGMEPDADIFDPEDPYSRVLEAFIHISGDEPASIPVLWLDTVGGSNVIDYNTKTTGVTGKINPYSKVLEEFVHISEDDPKNTPVLWICSHDSTSIGDTDTSVDIVDITVSEV